MSEAAEARAARFAAAGAFLPVLPPGPGPFAVVVHLHGCGGLRALQRAYAEAARARGVASLIVDSYRPRGVGRARALATVCTGLALRGAERAGDLLAALAHLRTQPWADPGRIAAAGWSHGGWTVMDALSLGAAGAAARAGLAPPREETFAALRFVFLVYPWCGIGSRTIARGWRVRPPAHMLLAGRDSVAGTRDPERAARRLVADGVDLAVTVFPEATHSFDDEATGDPRFRFDPALFSDARALFARTLAARLG